VTVVPRVDARVRVLGLCAIASTFGIACSDAGPSPAAGAGSGGAPGGANTTMSPATGAGMGTGTGGGVPNPGGSSGSGSGGHMGTAGVNTGTGGMPVSDAGITMHMSDGATPGMDATTGGSDAATGDTSARLLVPDPSWTCNMPDGILPPAGGELAFEVTFTIKEIHDLGETQYGQREQIDISGGSLKGPKIDAQVQDGSLDYQLTLANGSLEIEEVVMLQTTDGTLIYVRFCGTGPSLDDVRVVPDFEAPNAGAHAWLNDAKLAGTRVLDRAGNKVTLRVFDVSSVAAPADKLQLQDPAGVPNQSWECAQPMGAQGAVVYMETVGIGGSLAVGDSKRGTRNVIPITGGTTSGRIAGGIMSGGGDYQLIGTSFVLDARYTLKPDGGDELIIVRNCGPVGALVPVFETRKDGTYAWVNEGPWLSSDPGVGVGVVNLTIYETN